MMKRRDFILALGSSAATWPLTARAQQTRMPVIGFLHTGTADGFASSVAGFRRGLRVAGFIENENATIEFSWADNNAERLPALATDLVRQQVTVIVSGGGAASALPPRQSL
jgi:putative ABC transport system substrate-binding protein